MSKEQMSLSVNVNGQSKVPPGFRFHPTEEELLHYYLRKKVAYEKIDLDVIRDIDLNKLEPWDIQEKCRIGSTPQNDWYFFSHKDKKYPTGTRTNRATAAGFWKATGRDKVIYSKFKRIGMRKTLVFYRGRAPHGQKADWIMHEYRLDDNNTIPSQDYVPGSIVCDSTQEEGWVVCRVFKKKNYHKAVISPQRSSSTTSMDSTPQIQPLNKDHDQFLVYIDGRSCKQETYSLTHDYNTMQQFMINPINDRLPRLDTIFDQDSTFRTHDSMTHETEHIKDRRHLDSLADLDRLVASSKQIHPNNCYDEDICFPIDHHDGMAKPSYTSVIDLWSFAQSSSQSSSPDPFYHLPV